MGTDAEVNTPSHQLRQTLMQTPLKDDEVLPLHTQLMPFCPPECE